MNQFLFEVVVEINTGVIRGDFSKLVKYKIVLMSFLTGDILWRGR